MVLVTIYIGYLELKCGRDSWEEALQVVKEMVESTLANGWEVSKVEIEYIKKS